jgi:MSHA biogenesis protein MshI
VDFTPTGVAVVDVKNDGKQRGAVTRSAFLPAVGAAEQTQVLQQWVDANGLKNAPCFALIAKHDVQIFQLEKPAVEADELLQAVSWKVKDLISYDVTTAVVDIFELPPSPKNPKSYINAVVANESVVAGYVDSIRAADLDLRVIDVHDLVARNFQLSYDLSSQTAAILQFSDNAGQITVYHDRDLYVARDFKIGLRDIENAGAGDEALYDNLLLELQRSMDYFESTFGMGNVQKLVMFPRVPGTEKMASYLQNYVAYELDFAHIDQLGDAAALERHCFPAYCAALRGVH